MKHRRVRFEITPDIPYIEVLVRASERDEAVEELLSRLSETAQMTLTAAGPDGALCKLPVREIVYVSVKGKQIQLMTENQAYTIRQTLQSLEQTLEEQGFVRISRYEMVNLQKVRKYDFTLNGTLRLELAGGTETWASRRCIPAIRRRLAGKE